MFLADAHTHSNCSPDSETPMAEMVRGAEDAGLNLLCFTDHFDLLSLTGELTLTHDWSRAQEAFARTKAEMKTEVQLRLGVELGGAPVDFAAAEQVRGQPLDFVIGSVHNLSQGDGGMEFCEVTYTDAAHCRRLMEDYLTTMEQLSRWDGYDVLGHIPYPLRYMRDRDGQAVEMTQWEDRVRGILSQAVARGKGIEVNTNRGRSLPDYDWILRSFRELGGELVTIGSDAHCRADVGKGAAEAQELLRACGFRYFAVYSGRKPELHPL